VIKAVLVVVIVMQKQPLTIIYSYNITLREESVCGRKFCGSAEPQNFYVFAGKTFAVGGLSQFCGINFYG